MSAVTHILFKTLNLHWSHTFVTASLTPHVNTHCFLNVLVIPAKNKPPLTATHSDKVFPSILLPNVQKGNGYHRTENPAAGFYKAYLISFSASRQLVKEEIYTLP